MDADRSTVARTNANVIQYLSPSAKAVIQAGIDSGAFADRAEMREPAFMAPSTDPGDYSKVYHVQPAFPIDSRSRCKVVFTLL